MFLSKWNFAKLQTQKLNNFLDKKLGTCEQNPAGNELLLTLSYFPSHSVSTQAYELWLKNPTWSMIDCSLAHRWIYGFLTLIESQPRFFSFNWSWETEKEAFLSMISLAMPISSVLFQTHYLLRIFFYFIFEPIKYLNKHGNLNVITWESSSCRWRHSEIIMRMLDYTLLGSR